MIETTEQENPAPHFDEGYFSAADGTQLYELSLSPKHPRAAALFVHGYGDHGGRYLEPMRALAIRSVASYAFDYRGHGHAAGRPGYVGSFDHYLEDLGAMLARIKNAHPELPIFLIGHSLGGLISSLYLCRMPCPIELSGLVLSSPYFKLRIRPSLTKLLLAKTIGTLWPWVPVRTPIQVGHLTRDPEKQAQLLADPLKRRVVTPGWFKNSQAAQLEISQNWDQISLPLLVFLGAEDPIAHPEATQRFVKACRSSDKRLVLLPGGVHEPFSDLDRHQVIRQLTEWIEARTESRAPQEQGALPSQPLSLVQQESLV